MWPWEHAAISYVGYSVYCRGRQRRPTGGAVLAGIAGALFPDIVDKPLAWSFGILPAGRSLGHSLLFAIPVSVLVVLGARWAKRQEIGLAFAAWYLFHLPMDVLSPVLFGKGVSTRFLLWPVVSVPEQSGPDVGFNAVVQTFFGSISGPMLVAYAAGELLLLGSAAVLWRYDGFPGVGEQRRTDRLNHGD